MTNQHLTLRETMNNQTFLKKLRINAFVMKTGTLCGKPLLIIIPEPGDISQLRLNEAITEYTKLPLVYKSTNTHELTNSIKIDEQHYFSQTDGVDDFVNRINDFIQDDYRYAVIAEYDEINDNLHIYLTYDLSCDDIHQEIAESFKSSITETDIAKFNKLTRELNDEQRKNILSKVLKGANF